MDEIITPTKEIINLPDKELFTNIWTSPRQVFKYKNDKYYNKYVSVSIMLKKLLLLILFATSSFKIMAQVASVKWAAKNYNGYLSNVISNDEKGFWAIGSDNTIITQNIMRFLHYDKNLKLLETKKYKLPNSYYLLTSKKEANNFNFLFCKIRGKVRDFFVYRFDKEMNLINIEKVRSNIVFAAKLDDMKYEWNSDSSRYIIFNNKYRGKTKNWNENHYILVFDKDLKLIQSERPHLDINEVPFSYLTLFGMVSNRYIVLLASTFELNLDKVNLAGKDYKSWILCYDLQTKKYETIKLKEDIGGLLNTKFFDAVMKNNVMEIFGTYSQKNRNYADGFLKFVFNPENNTISEPISNVITKVYRPLNGEVRNMTFKNVFYYGNRQFISAQKTYDMDGITHYDSKGGSTTTNFIPVDGPELIEIDSNLNIVNYVYCIASGKVFSNSLNTYFEGQPIFSNKDVFMLYNSNAKQDDKIHFATTFGNGFVLCITKMREEQNRDEQILGVTNNNDLIYSPFNVPFYKISENEFIIWGVSSRRSYVGLLNIVIK